MNNETIIANLFAKLVKEILFRMDPETFGESYENAKKVVAEKSVAGAAVWGKLDAHFSPAPKAPETKLFRRPNTQYCYRVSVRCLRTFEVETIFVDANSKPSAAKYCRELGYTVLDMSIG